MTGVYLLGEQPGTILRGNLVHDIIDYASYAECFYTDQGSSYVLIENNIGYNCTDAVLYQHFGKENIVRNNIFAFGNRETIRSTTYSDPYALKLEGNILLGNMSSIYVSDGLGVTFPDDGNLMWDYTFGKDVVSFHSLLSEQDERSLHFLKKSNARNMKEKGFYKNAVIADPLFVDALNYDFTLLSDSPALEMGFEPIDMSDVGPRK